MEEVLTKNKGAKYYYNGKKVYSYCKEEMLDYNNVIKSIRYYQKIYDWDLETAINYVIKNYMRIRKYKKTINFIKWMEKTNTYRFVEISECLNIEYASLNKLYKKGFSKQHAFYIVWFLTDKINKNGKLSISSKQIKKFINILNSHNYDENTEFIYLFTLYRLGNKDVLEYLPKVREKAINAIIFREIDYLNENIKNKVLNDINDLKQDIMIKEQMILYNNICFNRLNSILKYLNVYAKYYVIDDIKKKINENCVSLDALDNSNRCGYDYLTHNNNWE